MSNLTILDKLKLEKILQMEGGYVLDFYNPGFQAFIFEKVGIDIEQEKYKDAGNSKAKRLRSFWNQENNNIVGKLILALLEYWKWYKLNSGSEISASEKALFDECLQISERLLQEGHNDEALDEVTINAHFEQIQKNIIYQINQAKFIIWVAVAWVTDKILFDHLVEKKNQGINVQLIIIDDEINKNSGLNYEKIEIYKIKKNGAYENIMHNKFCIIDLKTVIHGSYNWTKKAKFNNETIEVVNNRLYAEKFAEQFIQLKKL